VLERHGVEHTLAWTLGGEPFLTPGQPQRGAGGSHRRRDRRERRAVDHRRHLDGRFIAKICPQVVEFGPLNATIHKIDERRARQPGAIDGNLPAHAENFLLPTPP
jgi:succinyl-diaminopimelate desuccinylase